MDQRAAQGQFLFHAPREFAGAPGAKRPDLFIDIADERIVLFNGRSKQRREKIEIFFDREILVQRKTTGHIANTAADLTEFFGGIETGDGRCFITLTGVARFRVIGEAPALTPYRQARVDFAEFSSDFREGEGEGAVDRPGLLTALRRFAEANKFKVDWDDIKNASNEALVNGLSMLSPYGVKEKQALLEASDLKARADMLVAITQMELARGENASTQIH